jgi:hypothetical protein
VIQAPFSAMLSKAMNASLNFEVVLVKSSERATIMKLTIAKTAHGNGQYTISKHFLPLNLCPAMQLVQVVGSLTQEAHGVIQLVQLLLVVFI